MTTLLITHPIFTAHAPPAGHPERPDRMRAIEKALSHEIFAPLKREEAAMGRTDDITLAHPESYIRHIERSSPDPGDEVALDPDTWMNEASLEAATRAVGAATRAVDEVMAGTVQNVFGAVRPPGHHAERTRAMGFCLFSTAAIAGLYARAKHGVARAAVIDFDVHHGNGTQDVYWNEPDMFYGSTHQMPLYPGTGAIGETGQGNIWNAPLRPGDGSLKFREAMKDRILPALSAHRPDILIISAGFDAHKNDPLGGLELTEEDFAWATLHLMEIADRHCDGRVVSLLEGGYDLTALARSTAVHVNALMRGTAQRLDEVKAEVTR